MKGLTNSINIITGGGKTDLYHGLRPANWPAVRLPSTMTTKFCDLIIEFGNRYDASLPSPLQSKKASVQATLRGVGSVDWGDGTQDINSSTSWENYSHQYTLDSEHWDADRNAYVYYIKADGSFTDIGMNEGTLKADNYIREISCNVFSLSLEYRGDCTQDVYFFSGDYNYYQMLDSLNMRCFPELTFSGNLDSLSFGKISVLPDLPYKVANVSIQSFLGEEWNPKFINNVENLTITNLSFSPIVEYLPNMTNKITAKSTSNFTNIEVFNNTELTLSGSYTASPFSSNIVKTPKVITTNNCDGRYLFANLNYLTEITLDPSTFKQTSGSSSLNWSWYKAFYNCVSLVYIHMPENSLKAYQIDLVRNCKTWITDVEPRDNSMTVSEYAWTEIAKGLWNFKTNPDSTYTKPLLLAYSGFSDKFDSLMIDGVSWKEYVTNKGWTITLYSN